MTLGLSLAQFSKFHINCYNGMNFVLCILHHKSKENTIFELNCVSVAQ